ncbi:protein transport protein SEC31 [Strigomonas culicis]|uniref:Protein transport protein SEC31 n=1 Tax=Strigomonas culicis TaxID=28005 RepID=S9V300_9TRYP|nr:protein transport protein SEC31 [Strigomonas culicis]|eukprot:EPY17175.1 protein transport protein SEC31 [Strigomonas culicis]
MRLKTIASCAAFAWSPEKLGSPPLLALASFSGAMDDDFSNEPYMTFYVCDVTRTDETELRPVGRVRLPDRACRIDWSLHMGAQGIVAVACNNGTVAVYAVAAVLAAKGGDAGPQALLWSLQAHQGAAHGCQFNVMQPNFLATGGDDGKWFVWSIPAKAQDQPQRVAAIANSAQATAITDIQWHPKYHHIVATATAGGVVCTWNLKTLSLAMKINVGKGAAAGAATCLAWHPTAATTIAVGVDDANPVVQIWDLKRVLSPERELKGHERAVTGLSWSARDTSLLASCGADGHTMWWDPATGKRLGELEAEAHGVVAVQWCPALSGVLATASLEPRFCVSTAEDMRSAPGGERAGAAPRWMQERPCGASVNAALTVASLAPGTADQLQLTSLAPRRPAC